MKSTKNTKRVGKKLRTKPRMGIRVIALLELALFFSVTAAVDFFLLGGARFQDFNPHPFWLPVVFLSIQYGTKEGLLAAVAATAVFLVGNLPELKLSQDIYEYVLDVSLQPILWHAAAVVIGELHGRQVQNIDALRRLLADNKSEKDMVCAAYIKLREVKDALEIRVAAQTNTFSTAFRAARSLRGANTEAVYTAINGFVHDVLGPEKFSFFDLTDGGFEARHTCGWTNDNEFARVIPRKHRLFDHIFHDKGTLNAADPHHERVLNGQGVFAGTICCNGNVVGMLKIEALDFAKLSKATLNDFQVMCDWVSDALTLAAQNTELQVPINDPREVA